MNGNSGWNKLNDAMKTLAEAWDQTESGWRDFKRVEFEKHSIAPIESQVGATLRGMQQLNEVLSRLRRECRDDAE